MDNLLDRIHHCLAHSEEAEEVFPPAALAVILDAENRLGFELPALLREIYMQVGNGGFGPGYGLIGVDGGAPDGGRSVVDLYHSYHQPDPHDPFWLWPDGLLPICHWGCGIFSCLDCSKPDAPVVVFDPNWHKSDEDETPQPWDHCFFVHTSSFAAWMELWIDDVDLWEQTRRRNV